MNNPLIGSIRINYIYFYSASLTSIFNFFILLFIMIIFLNLSNEISILLSNANDLINKIDYEIPYLKRMISDKIEEVCNFHNITNYKYLNLKPN